MQGQSGVGGIRFHAQQFVHQARENAKLAKSALKGRLFTIGTFLKNQKAALLAKKTFSERSPVSNREFNASTATGPSGDGSAVAATAVKVSEIASRYGLTETQVRTLENQGKLETVLQKADQASSSAEFQQFMQTTAGDKASLNDLSQLFYKQAMLNNKETAEHKIHGATFTLTSRKVVHEKKLGEGTFGTAYKVSKFSTETFKLIRSEAAKVSNVRQGNQGFNDSALRDIKTEATNLYTISQRAKDMGRQDVLEGLQEPPRKVKVKTIGGVSRGIMKGKIYQGDLRGKCIQQQGLTLGQKMDGFDGLLKGFAFIQRQGLVHVDIKPDNIFVDTNSEGKTLFRLADFGGARWSGTLAGTHSMSHTPTYTPLSEIPNNSTSPERLQALSTFQMGATLFETITGGRQYPYPLVQASNGQWYRDTSKPFNEQALIQAGCPQEMVNLVKAMMDPNPLSRPTGARLEQQWQGVKQMMSARAPPQGPHLQPQGQFQPGQGLQQGMPPHHQIPPQHQRPPPYPGAPQVRPPPYPGGPQIRPPPYQQPVRAHALPRNPGILYQSDVHNIDQSTALALIAGVPPGTYILRRSSDGTSIVISHKDREGRIHQYKFGTFAEVQSHIQRNNLHYMLKIQ